MFIVRSKISAVFALPTPPSSATPALLNAKLSWPKCSTVRATSASISVSTATSTFKNRPSPPAFSISCTDSSPSFSRRPLTTTLAPSSANAIAVARPIPDVPPVINMTFPANRLMCVLILVCVLKINFAITTRNRTPCRFHELHAGRVCYRARRRSRALLGILLPSPFSLLPSPFSLLTFYFLLSMRRCLFLRRTEVLDSERQRDSDAGRHNQSNKAVQIGEQRSLLIQYRVELALRTIRCFEGRITGMHEN